MSFLNMLKESFVLISLLGSVYILYIVGYGYFGQQAMDSLVWLNTLISLAFCLSPSVLLYKADLLGLAIGWVFLTMSIFASLLWLQEHKMFGGKKVMFYNNISNNGRTLFNRDTLAFLAQRFCRGSTVYLFNSTKPSQHHFHNRRKGFL